MDRQELLQEETPHGRQVIFGGRRLYGDRPLPDVRRRLASLSVPPGSVILWYSPGIWHGLAELVVRAPADTLVIALEAEEQLCELARATLPAEAADRVCLAGADTAVVLAALRGAGRRHRRLLELTTTSTALLHRSWYRRVRDAVDAEIRTYWQNRMTLAAMGRLWVRNVIRNLPLLAGPVEPLPSASGPIVVCGAGPSLDASLPVLARRREAAFVVAVDTALPVLDAHRITPDVVVALEGQLWNLYDFLPVAGRPWLLVTDLTANPGVAALHARRFWTLSRFAPLALVDRLAGLPAVLPIPPLGSVGVAAVEIAQRIGNGPLFLTGLDFAVLPGRSHAHGAPSDLRALVRSTRLRPAVDSAFGVRTVAVEGDEASRRPASAARTTLALTGYAAQLRGSLADCPQAAVVAPIGLGVGVQPIDVREFESRLAGTRRPAIPPAAAPRRPTREELARFVEAEIALLDRLLGASDESERRRLQEACAYVGCDDPAQDRPDDAAARRREMIGADYYRERWRCCLTRLRS